MIRTCAAGLIQSLAVLFLVPTKPTLAASKPNLVLITLDSARADRMGFLGARGNLTPNLNRLAAESIVFEHAYAQAPGTVVSHATILSGAYPQSTDLSEIGGTLTPSLPYLPDLLKAQGYKTAAFVGSIDLDPWSGLAQGFDRGFQTYDAGFRPAILGTSASAGTGASAPLVLRSGAEVVSHATAWLAHNAQGPFFLWVNINDADATRASYSAGIITADAAVGKLLSALKAQKLDANTAILVVSDHGQSLGSHGEDSHGIFLYDEPIHVPLLVKLPEAQPAAKQVAAKVRLVDIAPTLLEIAGIPVPSQMLGQSLLRIAKSGADQPVYSRSDLSQRGFGWSPLESWRAGKYLYIRAPTPELYDTTADPGATHNLAQSSKATLDTMAAQLEGLDRRFSGEAGKSSSDLTSSEMQKLASLGYVGLQRSSGTASAVTGTDPKDKIATANKVLEATSPSALAPSKPDRVIAALTPVVAADENLYLAEYALGVALVQRAQNTPAQKAPSTQAQKSKSAEAQKAANDQAQKAYAEALKHLHKAIELQPDSGWAHYAIGATLLKSAILLKVGDPKAAEDFKTAAVHLEISTARLPAFAPAPAALAQAYDHLGRADDAKRERARSQ